MKPSTPGTLSHSFNPCRLSRLPTTDRSSKVCRLIYNPTWTPTTSLLPSEGRGSWSLEAIMHFHLRVCFDSVPCKKADPLWLEHSSSTTFSRSLFVLMGSLPLPEIPTSNKIVPGKGPTSEIASEIAQEARKTLHCTYIAVRNRSCRYSRDGRPSCCF